MKWQPRNIPAVKYLIGIDEVGRGPLAGPVTVCAIAVPVAEVSLFKIQKLGDSKALKETVREEWKQKIQNTKWPASIVSVSHEVIDKKGIMVAIAMASTKALSDLEKKGISKENSFVLADAGLPVLKTWRCAHFVKGDATYVPIALASILAKQHRDRLMMKFDILYPCYGFKDHKGYGTNAHYKAIHRWGISKIHRKSFLTRIPLKNLS